jgi:quinol monooxygenase YgiN
MIIVEGWVRLAPGALEQFLPAATAMIAASRAEPGCLDYAYGRDLLDPDIVRIAERWTDEAAMAAHFETPHLIAFRQTLAALDIKAGAVHVYTGEHQRALIER